MSAAAISGDKSGHVWDAALNTNEVTCRYCGVRYSHTAVVAGSVPVCFWATVAAPPASPGSLAAQAALLYPPIPAATTESFFGPDRIAEPADRSRCISCKRELSKTLDACYDRDEYKALQCVRCRR